MIWTEATIRTVLDAAPPGRGEAALRQVHGLVPRLAYLGWPDRGKILDEFFWAEASQGLPSDIVTAVINRQSHIFRPGHPSRAYAAYCMPIVAGILLMLGEKPEIRQHEQALTLALSCERSHREAARHWLELHRFEQVRETLAQLPGYAFMFLTIYAQDAVESFMARDAFWEAMLGHQQ